MKLKWLIIVSFIISNFVTAQQVQLSNSAEITILTIGPGTSLNDAFGHSAFRVIDASHNIDAVYGYGQYDFNAPNFYLNFAKGRLKYLMSKNKYVDFYNFYKYHNRSITEQVLNLNTTQKQRLYNYLINNYQPENKAYLYDYFYDNCATKIKNVTEVGIGKPIEFNIPNHFEPKSFRTLIHEEAGTNNWGIFGIDVALGSIIDQKITYQEYLFLPKYIHQFFEDADIDPQTTLVKKTTKVYEQSPKKTSVLNLLLSPFVIFSAIGLLIIFISIKDHKKQQRTKWLDTILFGVTGIIGILLLLLWFGTDHYASAYNYNILWAFPINLLVLYQLHKAEPKKWFKGYLKFLILMLCLMTLHWVIGVQVFSIALLPFGIGLIVRYITILKLIKA